MLTRHVRAKAMTGWIVPMLIPSLILLGTSIAVANGNSKNGKALYQESCQHCHGFIGKGDGQMAEYLEPPPANLTNQTTQAKTDGELKDLILKGKEGTAMAGFEGAFEELQLNDLLEYLRSLKP